MLVALMIAARQRLARRDEHRAQYLLGGILCRGGTKCRRSHSNQLVTGPIWADFELGSRPSNYKTFAPAAAQACAPHRECGMRMTATAAQGGRRKEYEAYDARRDQGKDDHEHSATLDSYLRERDPENGRLIHGAVGRAIRNVPQNCAFGARLRNKLFILTGGERELPDQNPKRQEVARAAAVSWAASPVADSIESPGGMPGEQTTTAAGETWVVTGAAWGVGLTLARALVAAGATVHGWDENEVPADAGTWHRVDLTRAEDIIVAAAAAGDRVHCVAHCGAVFLRATLDDLDAADKLQLSVAVHCGSFLRTVQALTGPLVSARGSAVAITSIAQEVVYPGSLVYGPSKAALRQLIRNLATLLGPRGVRVNGIAPGGILTPMSDFLRTDSQADAGRLRAVPLGRRAKPDEIAAVVRFLASNNAAFINGAVITVDGGLEPGLGALIPV
jgi:NAD(P)-dependent dehydrogenase (short-subunit alcohol dehydrogenase family)